MGDRDPDGNGGTRAVGGQIDRRHRVIAAVNDIDGHTTGSDRDALGIGADGDAGAGTVGGHLDRVTDLLPPLVT